MEYLKNKAEQASQTIQGKSSEAEAKGNKEVAKGNTDADLRTRAEAVGDYAGNKMDQKSSESQANMHKAKADA